MVILKKIIDLLRRFLGFNKKERYMPQGLEVRDENGGVISTVTDRMSLVVAVIEMTGHSNTYTVSSSLFQKNDVYVIAPQTPNFGFFGTQNNQILNWRVEGNTCIIETKNLKYEPYSNYSIIVGVY